ncbi:MAG: LysR family transcriptional regulator [Pseudomonadota bacterium]
MTFKQLIMLDAIAETGSFRKAADRLAISQPPLSIQMKKLEQTIGADLFDRSGRQAMLTPTGELLAGQAKKLIGEFDASLRTVRSFASGESGVLRIGFTDEFIGAPMFERTLKFISANPGVRTSTEIAPSHRLLKRMRSGDLDIILTNFPLRENLQWLDVFALPSTRIRLAVPKNDKLSLRQRIKPQELNGRGVIMYHNHSQMALALRCRELLSSARVEPRTVHETDNTDIQIEMVRMGVGCCFLAQYAFDASARGIAVIEIDHPLARLDHAIVYQSDRATPALNRLVQLLTTDTPVDHDVKS